MEQWAFKGHSEITLEDNLIKLSQVRLISIIEDIYDLGENL